MVGRKLLGVLFVLLVGISLVQAYSVQKVWVDWKGHEVKTISPTKSLPGATLKLILSSDVADCFGKYQNDARCSVTIRASSIGVPSTSMQIRSCAKNTDSTYNCTSAPFTFATTSAANTLTAEFQVGPMVPPTQNLDLPITLDTTNPTVTSIATGYCADGVCYAAANVPTPVTITFSDTVTSFDYDLVWLGKEGASITAQVDDCKGTTCTGSIIIPCGDGDKLTLQVKSIAGVDSREDAQNSVVRNNGVSVVCSTKSPQIIDWNQAVTDGLYGQIVAGGSITFTAHVRSSAGTPQGIVNTKYITGEDTVAATCTNDQVDQTIYTCTWQLKNLNNGTFPLDFKVLDQVGNYQVKSVKITVLNITKQSKVDFFTIQKGAVMPQSINRLALDLAAKNFYPYPLYVTYNLKQKAGNVQIVSQQLNRCWYKPSNETNYSNSQQYNLFSQDKSESRVLYPTQDQKKTNRLNLQIRAPSDVLAKSDLFNVVCQVDLIVAKDNNVYSTPDAVNISFDVGLREAPLGTPGEKFVTQIKNEEKRLNGPDQKFIRTLTTVRSTLQGVCTLMQGVSSIHATTSSLQSLSAALFSTGYGSGAATAMQAAANSPQLGSARLIDDIWSGNPFQSNALRQMCRQVSCRNYGDVAGQANLMQTNLMKNILSSDSSFLSEMGDANSGSGKDFVLGEMTKNLHTSDPKNSIVMSTMYGCVGGIIYNAQKIQDINCGYLQCLKDQSLNGGSVAVCSLGKGYKFCTQAVGEIFELPFVRVVKNLATNIDGLLKNAPGFVFKFFIVNKACGPYLNKPVVGADFTTAACHVMKSISNLVDYKQQTTQAFTETLQDSNICPMALCNPGDKNCGRSYDRLSKLEGFMSYLQFDRYVENQKKTTSPKEQSGQQQLFSALDRQWQQYCLSQANCKDDADKLSKYDITKADNTYYLMPAGDTSGVLKIPVDAKYTTTLDTVDTNNILSDFNNYQVYRNALDQGIIFKSPEEFTSYKTYLQNLGITNIYDEMKQVEQIDKLPPQQQINNIAQKQQLLQMLASQGYTRNGNVWQYTTTGQSLQAFAVSAVQKDPSLSSVFDAVKKDQNGGFSCDQTCENALKQKFCAGQSGCSFAATVGSSTYSITIDQNGNVKMTQNVDGSTQLTQQWTDRLKAINLYHTIDFVGTLAVKYAYDKGYLNFLSTSSYNGWGREVDEWSQTEISPDAWKYNLCNAAINIQDNEDGAILEASDTSFTKTVGTFAAEVMPIENESGKSYVYIYTIYITNPTQTPVPGQATQPNNFKLGAMFAGDNGKLALTSNFDLTEGTNIANGNGPKHGIIYSPTLYNKFCVTFDKPFPDVRGQKSYCRDIKEKVYDTGSPLPQGANVQSNGQNQPTPTGSGFLGET